MKRRIKKWTLRLTVTVLLIAALLLIIILNPFLTYANKTVHNNYTIYHSKALDPKFAAILDEATTILMTSEVYSSKFKLDICLNDGAVYPGLIKTIHGQAFAWGFYNKVVMQGTMNCDENHTELNGYKWNLTQLLAHEMTHCYQFHHSGFFASRPIGNIPNWKWEGYAEYASRQNTHQKDLVLNLDRLYQADKNSWEISFEDGTITPGEYYHYWTLVQYCSDIKKMTYQQLLDDRRTEAAIRAEMNQWYEAQKANTKAQKISSIR